MTAYVPVKEFLRTENNSGRPQRRATRQSYSVFCGQEDDNPEKREFARENSEAQIEVIRKLARERNVTVGSDLPGVSGEGESKKDDGAELNSSDHESLNVPVENLNHVMGRFGRRGTIQAAGQQLQKAVRDCQQEKQGAEKSKLTKAERVLLRATWTFKKHLGSYLDFSNPLVAVSMQVRIQKSVLLVCKDLILYSFYIAS